MIPGISRGRRQWDERVGGGRERGDAGGRVTVPVSDGRETMIQITLTIAFQRVREGTELSSDLNC
jgi:hypothetical protein